MQLRIVTVQPVQQVAAEPDTVEALITALRAHQPAPLDNPLPRPSPLGSLTDLPIVKDPLLPAGFVYLRPFPQPTAPPVTFTEDHS